jgi:hypothetical protein
LGLADLKYTEPSVIFCRRPTLGWDYIREIKILIVFHRESTIEISF